MVGPEAHLARRLTPTQLLVLRRACWGDSARETAVQLGIEYETVRTYRKQLCAKLGARNMVHAVALFYGLGVTPDREDGPA